MPQTTDWADVQVVGIPRALLFYRFGVLWTTFFESIGRTVVVSDPTDKAIADEGDRLSVDECCLASKVFVGHVESLVGRCDAVFVPCYPTSDHRSGFCTKFQSATDMVRNTFRDDKLRVISCEVQNARKAKDVRRAFCDMAARMGVAPKDARTAFKAAWDAQRAHDEALASAQERTLRRLVDERRAADAAAVPGTMRLRVRSAFSWWPTPTSPMIPIYPARSSTRSKRWAPRSSTPTPWIMSARTRRASSSPAPCRGPQPRTHWLYPPGPGQHRRHRAHQRVPLRPRLHDRRCHHALHPGYAHSEPDD